MRLACNYHGKVKKKVDPRPVSLSTRGSPAIFGISSLEIEKPKPVPPYLRVMEPSPCTNDSKIRRCASLEIPIPVSFTAKLILIMRSDSESIAASKSTLESQNYSELKGAVGQAGEPASCPRHTETTHRNGAIPIHGNGAGNELASWRVASSSAVPRPRESIRESR